MHVRYVDSTRTSHLVTIFVCVCMSSSLDIVSIAYVGIGELLNEKTFLSFHEPFIRLQFGLQISTSPVISLYQY